MENATKALLIAAAVLVAILIISLGLVVYNMASETINSVNFSGQEITAFNDQFMQYNGDNRRGSEVNAMLNTVLSSNMKSRSEGLTAKKDEPKFVYVEGTQATNAGGTKGIALDATATSIDPAKEASTSKLYKVTVEMSATSGFVSKITVADS